MQPSVAFHPAGLSLSEEINGNAVYRCCGCFSLVLFISRVGVVLSVHHVCAVLQKSEEGIRSPGTVIIVMNYHVIAGN